jgi:hypothetical protein
MLIFSLIGRGARCGGVEEEEAVVDDPFKMSIVLPCSFHDVKSLS